jgi:hypothetical protein
MSIREYTTWELDEVVRMVEVQQPFLLGRFFGRTKSFDTEQIEFDIVDRGRRIAPFVSPLVQGRVMRREGYRTVAFKPAYIKLTDLIRPTDTFTRTQGERPGGSMSPQARMDRLVAETYERHRVGIDIRKEWMCASALVNGSITVSGDSYPTVVVDLGRDPALTVALAGGARWSQTTADPMADIESMASLIRRKSRGRVLTDLIMNGVTWGQLRNLLKTDLVLAKLLSTQVTFSTNMSFDVLPRQMQPEGELVGNIAGRFRVWVYDGFYNDDAGAEQKFIPDYKVVCVSASGVEGVQYQGAILDIDANLEPRDIFTKSKLHFDPSGLELLTQTAPLCVMRMPNASGVLTVHV